MGLHRKQYKDKDNFIHNFAPKTDEVKDFPEPEKIPKPVKPRKADTRKELDEATQKMLDAFAKLNDRITEINTGLAEQKTVLEKLVKTDTKVHEEVKPTVEQEIEDLKLKIIRAKDLHPEKVEMYENRLKELQGK